VMIKFSDPKVAKLVSVRPINFTMLPSPKEIDASGLLMLTLSSQDPVNN